MGRRAVDLEVVFLDVLAVVPLAVGQADQALFEDRVLAVPQRHGKAQPLMVVAEARKAVFAPVIGAGPRLVVREIIPRIAVLAVVLADRAPLALTEIGAPLLPWHPVLTRLIKAYLFCGFIPCRLNLVRQRSPPFCVIRRCLDVVIAPFLSAALEALLQPGVWQAAPYKAGFRACSR